MTISFSNEIPMVLFFFMNISMAALCFVVMGRRRGLFTLLWKETPWDTELLCQAFPQPPSSFSFLFSVSPKMPIGPIAFKNPTTLRTLLWIWICERWHPGTPICYARHFPRVGRWFCNGDRLENLPFVLQEKCQIVWKSSEKETGKIVTQWKRLMCSLKKYIKKTISSFAGDFSRI